MGTYKIFKDFDQNIIKFKKFDKGNVSYKSFIKSEMDQGLSPVILTNPIMIRLVSDLFKDQKHNIYVQQVKFSENIEDDESKEFNDLLFQIKINRDNKYLKKHFLNEIKELNQDSLIDVNKINLLFEDKRLEIINNGMVILEDGSNEESVLKYIEETLGVVF